MHPFCRGGLPCPPASLISLLGCSNLSCIPHASHIVLPHLTPISLSSKMSPLRHPERKRRILSLRLLLQKDSSLATLLANLTAICIQLISLPYPPSIHKCKQKTTKFVFVFKSPSFVRYFYAIFNKIIPVTENNSSRMFAITGM